MVTSTALQCTDRSPSGSSIVVMVDSESSDNFMAVSHILKWQHLIHDYMVLEVPQSFSLEGIINLKGLVQVPPTALAVKWR